MKLEITWMEAATTMSAGLARAGGDPGDRTGCERRGCRPNALQQTPSRQRHWLPPRALVRAGRSPASPGASILVSGLRRNWSEPSLTHSCHCIAIAEGPESALQRPSPSSVRGLLGLSERAPYSIIGDRPYRRSDALARRRELMDAWATHCEAGRATRGRRSFGLHRFSLLIISEA
jgi:hypothetical protein